MRSNQIQLATIIQHFDAAEVRDVTAETRTQLAGTGVSFPAGGRIAIAVGSRGIASIAEIARATVDAVRAGGAEPFIIPAMGSHGGATAEGQREVLRGYGIDEAAMGCPVISSMDVVTLDGESAPRVYLSRDAYEADGIIVINRVKPHTDFHGPVESGLVKMLVIGLGKHAQALEMHSYGIPGLRDGIPMVARRVLETGKVLLGIGIVENAYDRVRCVRACPGMSIPETDAALLAIARQSMPSLPLDAIDLLIVDKIGKDISGTGMDTNIIGRIRVHGEVEPALPRVRMIVADALTEASHGNGLGIGLADIVTRKLHSGIDFEATYENVVTSGFPERGRMPLVAKDLPQAADWALRFLGKPTPETLVAMRIPSTLSLSHLRVTPRALALLQASPLWAERRMETDGHFSPMILD